MTTKARITTKIKSMPPKDSRRTFENFKTDVENIIKGAIPLIEDNEIITCKWTQQTKSIGSRHYKFEFELPTRAVMAITENPAMYYQSLVKCLAKLNALATTYALNENILQELPLNHIYTIGTFSLSTKIGHFDQQAHIRRVNAVKNALAEIDTIKDPEARKNKLMDLITQHKVLPYVGEQSHHVYVGYANDIQRDSYVGPDASIFDVPTTPISFTIEIGFPPIPP